MLMLSLNNQLQVRNLIIHQQFTFIILLYKVILLVCLNFLLLQQILLD